LKSLREQQFPPRNRYSLKTVEQFMPGHVSIPHTGNGLIATHVKESNRPEGRGVGTDLRKTVGSGARVVVEEEGAWVGAGVA
jgi:hypothetical protein